MELTSLQLKTVNSILELYNPLEKVICEFKSPTGSGKTLMASYFIAALIEQNPNDRFIFVIATPSSSSLPYFFEQKINKYKAPLAWGGSSTARVLLRLCPEAPARPGLPWSCPAA